MFLASLASTRGDRNVSRETLVFHKNSRSVTTRSGSSFGAQGTACSDERVARKEDRPFGDLRSFRILSH